VDVAVRYQMIYHEGSGLVLFEDELETV